MDATEVLKIGGDFSNLLPATSDLFIILVVMMFLPKLKDVIE